MKFLLISEFEVNIEQYHKMYLDDYIEHPDDIIVMTSFIDAKEFVQNILIRDQKHIDFIIIDFSNDTFYTGSVEFAQWIRSSSQEYSDSNFKVKSLPLFIMNNRLLLDRLFYEHINNQIDKLFDGLVPKPDLNKKIGLYNNPLAKGLDRWLDGLQSDFDNLDLGGSSDIPNMDMRIFSARDYKLKILSPVFFKKKTPMDYIWAGNKLNIIEATADSLVKLLKTYKQNPSLRNEKQIHVFLKTYNHLLKGEDYYDFIYEQHFYHNQSKSYEEVDLINLAKQYSVKKHELFEVKLPNQRFLYKDGSKVLKIAQKYINQVGVKYYNFFSASRNFEEIKNKFQQHNVKIDHQSFQYSLLMGNDEDKEQNSSVIKEYFAKMVSHVKLLTYDDLLKRHHYLHLRVTRFGVN